jgi:two-component system sensor histidine kinase/response regulator
MPAPKILVVDDQPINVQLLRRKLEREGLRVVVAYHGLEALKLVKQERPDLVLLDVMMPDMDGLEVCQRLQADEESRSIPVILITARTTKESKIEGLNVGAVDYITKPIDLDETLARVQTQLRFVAINREMVDLHRRLEEMRRVATIGAVTQGIAHNLNNLFGVLMGYIDLIRISQGLPEQVKSHLARIDPAAQRIVAIIRQLTTLTDKARPTTTKGSLPALLEGGVSRFHADYKLAAPVTIENPLGDLAIETNIEMFEEALSKVLINAWESYTGPSESPRPITIRAVAVENPEKGPCVELRVEDEGRGIHHDVRDNMFEPFTSTKDTVGVGMGLTIARHTLRNLDGDVTLEDRPKGGAIATLLHPIKPRPENPEGTAAT